MPYPGGKAGAGVAPKIINLMPPHRVYIEPFLGDAAVMRAKRPAAVNVGIDLDPAAPGLAWVASFEGGEMWKACSGSNFPVGRSHYAIHGDGIQILKTYRWTGDELVYCDPPYLMSTRSGRRQYRHEMSDLEHGSLLSVLRDLPCMVMVSGYWSMLYARCLEAPKWRSIQFEAMTRSGRTKTEWLWFNFEPPKALHDYNHLGAGFRERERIKRKKARWLARLKRMPDLERRCLLEALIDLETASLDPAGQPGPLAE